jgi:hypothetical protein
MRIPGDPDPQTNLSFDGRKSGDHQLAVASAFLRLSSLLVSCLPRSIRPRGIRLARTIKGCNCCCYRLFEVGIGCRNILVLLGPKEFLNVGLFQISSNGIPKKKKLLVLVQTDANKTS